MNRAATMVLGFAVLALLLSPLAAADLTVGGESRSYQLHGKDIEEHGVAAVDTTDSAVAAKSPTCRLSTDAKDSTCDEGSVATTAPAANLAVLDVHIALGNIEKTPTPTATARIQQAVASFQDTPLGAGIVLATATAASGLAVYLLWRILKFAGIAGLVPLYSHLRDDELLNDANRSRIFTLIKDEPGISTKDVADKLDLAWGTVTHHLGKLEKSRLVVSKKYGKYRRYFVNGGAEAKDTIAVLKIARTADVAEMIRTHPGITQKEVGTALGVSSSTILWHVRRLEATSLILKVRAGKAVKYFATDGLAMHARPPPVLQPLPAAGLPFGIAGPSFQP